jgi:hypothetical protein
MDVIKPPDKILSGKPSVFLAGSIEMGEAPDWQAEVAEMLATIEGYIFNPRRDDWDPTWEQSVKNEQFVYQVEWELEGLETADIALMYLVPGTMSPVSLLELGTFVDIPQAIVCCPEGFWRKGNVDIFCRRYGIPMVGDLEQAVEMLITVL